MKKRNFIGSMMSVISILFLSFVVASSAIAAQGGSGGGGGAGGGGGSGGGSGSGGGGTQSPDLGDLVVLLRNESGVPVLTADLCQQPLAAPGVEVKNLLDNTVACTPSSPTASCVIPVDPATCAIVVGYETYTQEVDFGRTSVTRSPGSVLDSQMQDVLVNLSTADCTTLDAAGRLVTSTVTNNLVTSAEIDSPLQNLAIYRQLMLTGNLGAASAPITFPNPLLAAARGLGAASDKEGKVGVDMIVYLNQILGLADETVTTYLPKICIDVREEVKGVVQTVRKCFLDYGTFSYNRKANFGSLPYPAYIPAGGPIEGYFEYLGVVDGTPTFGIFDGPILGAIPQLAAIPGLSASNIGGFAQAADDARAVIEFMHSWPVPGEYPTPLTCTASGATHYDVSISPESGLQVPVRMVSGTEGREFTLTVANAGPDAATGKVVLNAKDANGNSIPTFPRTYSFTNLLAGNSQSWTEGFTINYATTITWTATAEAQYDVLSSNNSVTKTTRVTGKGGGQSASNP